MAWLASPCLACHARLRHEGSNPASGEQHDAQKKKRGIKARPALDPLVSSGNPAHRYSSCAKTHRARPRHRMVHLATRTSGRSPQSPHKTESATVVLGCVLINRDWSATADQCQGLERIADSSQKLRISEKYKQETSSCGWKTV